jgi:purine-binding chemotaxis protein CheW
MSDDVKKKVAGRSDAKRFLVFSLGAEDYAIPLLSVKEVVALPDTTRVPHTPPYFLGIMNLRGQVISIFDLRLKLGMKAENTSETAVVICDFSPLCFGVVVNSVNSVLPLAEDEIKDKPEIESRHNSEYITGVTKVKDKLILLLDLAKALNIEDRLAVKRANTGKAA